jgi:hypothetical protein
MSSAATAPGVSPTPALTWERPFVPRLVFVKPWNEWAESSHLEPDLRHGHGQLQVTGEELDACQAATTSSQQLPSFKACLGWQKTGNKTWRSTVSASLTFRIDETNSDDDPASGIVSSVQEAE